MASRRRAPCPAWPVALLLALPMAACASMGADARYATPRTDDIQNGLVPEASRGLAESSSTESEAGVPLLSDVPTLGALFRNGSDGDVRGRTENQFGFSNFGLSTLQDTDGDGLPDTRIPATEQPKRARSMIYTASLALEVARVEDGIDDFVAFVESKNGYLESRDGATVTCRVPATDYEATLEHARGLGRVLDQKQRVQDVTEQHRDLRIRLDNAKVSRDRLLALLEKADKVEDVLKIEKELQRLTSEIERYTAALQSLEDRVALSTIAVSFAGIAEVEPKGKRRASRFAWINRVGAEHVLRRF